MSRAPTIGDGPGKRVRPQRELAGSKESLAEAVHGSDAAPNPLSNYLLPA